MKFWKDFFSKETTPELDKKVLSSISLVLKENKRARRRKWLIALGALPVSAVAALTLFLRNNESEKLISEDDLEVAEYLEFMDLTEEEIELLGDLEFIEDLDVLEEIDEDKEDS